MLNKNESELTDVISIFLKQLGVKVTNRSIKRHLQSQPEGNNLLNASQALTKWKIENAAYRVSARDIHLVPCPFLAKTSFKEAHFVVVCKVGESEVTICRGNRRKCTYSLSHFVEHYEGIVLAAESDDTSGELDYRKKRTAELIGDFRLPMVYLTVAFCLAVALFFFSPYSSVFNWRIGSLMISKSLGIFTAALLVFQTIGNDSWYTRKLCNFGNVDCGSVIESAGAKTFWGTVTWSELGLLYFSSTFLLLFFFSDSPGVLHFLSLGGMACLCYTFYSIYYQALVIKKWCLLCCFIQLLFWVEAGLFLSFLSGVPTYTSRDRAAIGLCLGLPVACWSFLRPFLYKSKQADNMTGILAKFLYNEQLFTKILQEQPKHSLPKDRFSIILGNKLAENKITIVIKPFCGHCAEVYSEIDEIFGQALNFGIEILFATSTDSNEQEIALVKDILSIYINNRTGVIGALRSWFSSPNYPHWSKKHRVPMYDNQMIEDILFGQQEWCKHENIIITPTILVNGYELPEFYPVRSLPELLN